MLRPIFINIIFVMFITYVKLVVADLITPGPDFMVIHFLCLNLYNVVLH